MLARMQAISQDCKNAVPGPGDGSFDAGHTNAIISLLTSFRLKLSRDCTLEPVVRARKTRLRWFAVQQSGFGPV
ncbi:hypothetical protein LAB1_21310 [Roseibium sp. LAB1]